MGSLCANMRFDMILLLVIMRLFVFIYAEIMHIMNVDSHLQESIFLTDRPGR